MSFIYKKKCARFNIKLLQNYKNYENTLHFCNQNFIVLEIFVFIKFIMPFLFLTEIKILKFHHIILGNMFLLKYQPYLVYHIYILGII
jgi:hypothetical protein